MKNNVIEIKGEYGTAKVFADIVEDTAMSQIYDILNHPISKGIKTRIMPDVHAGVGCVIGYTAELSNIVIPNLIGVDIGCGVIAYNLGKIKIAYKELDDFIRNEIPSGRNIYESFNQKELEDNIHYIEVLNNFRGVFNHLSTEQIKSYIKNRTNNFLTSVTVTCNYTNQNINYVLNSLGTLGGGNHFIEIDRDSKNNLWLVIHSGSRNFGYKVAKYHQDTAKKETWFMSEKEYKERVDNIKSKFSGKKISEEIAKLNKISKHPKIQKNLGYLKDPHQYYEDMKIAQTFANFNRKFMAIKIIKFLDSKFFDSIESVHNYINFNDGIVRKGAISAHKDEPVIIPLNMAEGNIIGVGKGNVDWNYSAPHGTGRIMSRRNAKESININEYKNSMQGIWTSSVNENTLDEAPQAYKDANNIIKYLEDTITITDRLIPIYNFKSND